MTPGARLAAAAEILEEIFARRAAADRVLMAWGRDHRFAGSKDRAAIGERVYAVLRRLNECALQMESDTPRSLVLGSLSVVDGLSAEDIGAMCADGTHAIGALRQDEIEHLSRKAAAPPNEPWLGLNYPAWLHEPLVQAFGRDLDGEMKALNERAPLDLRVNTLKADRAAVLDELRADGFEAAPTPLAPHGIRIAPGADAKLTRLDAYASGRVEIQDEASQLSVMLAGARAGETVIDLAAGAGGKSLALAAAMQNRGRVLACDIAPARLKNVPERAARAGVSIIDLAGDPYAVEVAAPNLVFVDAPCSGSGTWRRNPEAKWTLTPERLAEYRDAQHRLLARAAELQPRRIVYAVCSVLAAEGPEQVGAFLAAHDAWALVPASALVPAVAGAGETLRLTPARHGTDGFFVAVLERRR